MLAWQPHLSFTDKEIIVIVIMITISVFFSCKGFSRYLGNTTSLIPQDKPMKVITIIIFTFQKRKQKFTCTRRLARKGSAKRRACALCSWPSVSSIPLHRTTDKLSRKCASKMRFKIGKSGAYLFPYSSSESKSRAFALEIPVVLD